MIGNNWAGGSEFAAKDFGRSLINGSAGLKSWMMADLRSQIDRAAITNSGYRSNGFICMHCRKQMTTQEGMLHARVGSLSECEECLAKS